MKVLIFTDSRGFFPKGEKTWINHLKQAGLKHDIEHVVGKERIKTIFQIGESLKSAKEIYDLIIIQTAYSDFVAHWPLSILQKRFKKFDKQLEKHLVESTGSGSRQLYRYTNYKGIENQIIEIRKHCKNLLFIGLHLSTSLNPNQVKNVTVYTNNLIAQHVDSLLFPVNISWTKNHCYDGIHYSGDTHAMVGNFVERYIGRLGKSVVDYV